MAVTQNTYTGNGSTTNYSFTFPYLETTDIKVSLNGTLTTAYTLANATTIQFNTAPTNGVAIRIYRETDDSGLAATFYPGSAIRSQDLNDNFTQNLYVTQESNRESARANQKADFTAEVAADAVETANTALATANTSATESAQALSNSQTALTQSSAAVSTSNAASSAASSAVTTANTAASNASTALSTSQTALTQSSNAVTTANQSATAASSALSNSQTALTQSSTAVTTSNSASALSIQAAVTANKAEADSEDALETSQTALAQSAAAVSTANQSSTTAATALSNSQTALNQSSAAVATSDSAASNAATALSTSQTALTQSATAITTANTASTNSSEAVSTANTANTKADQAIAAVSSSINYQLVPNVAAIPASPANDTYIEVQNSTLLELFTPLVGKPNGFIGDGGLSVRLRYTSAGSTWNWLNYYANNSETRYLKLTGGTLTGPLTLAGAPSANLHPATKAYVDSGVTQLTNAITSLDSTKLDSSVAASTYLTLSNAASTYAPLASPTFTGVATAPTFSVTGSTVPSNGFYLPSANTVGIATANAGRVFINGSGRVGINTSVTNVPLTVQADSGQASIRIPGRSVDNVSYAEFTDSTQAVTYGFFRSGPTYLAVGTGTTEAIRLNDSGNTGFGTTAPGSRVDVKGTLRLSGSTSGYVGLAPAAAAGSTTYTLPSADGTAGQVLSTSGNGQLSWTSNSAPITQFAQVLTTDLTISSGSNALSLVEVELQDGVTVTIPQGSTWIIAS